MISPIFESNNQFWNINMLLDQEQDTEIEDDDTEEEEESKEKTPDMNDNVFNEEHTATSVELF